MFDRPTAVINYMFLHFICDQAWRLKTVVVSEENTLKRFTACRGDFFFLKFTAVLPVGLSVNQSLYKRHYSPAELATS